MSAKQLTQLAVLGCLVVATAACDGVQPERRDIRYFAPFQTNAPKAEVFEDRGPQLSDAEQNVYEPIISGFQKNHEALLQRGDIVDQLERIENVYVQAGRYLELYAIYQKDYAKRGVESVAAARLGWGHIRLGQQQAARKLIDDLKAKKPTATAYFLDGAYHMQWDEGTPEDRALVAAAWRKAIELDPNYRGFEGITAAMLREQVARLDAMLAQNPPRPVEPAKATPPVEVLADADAGTPDEPAVVAAPDAGADSGDEPVVVAASQPSQNVPPTPTLQNPASMSPQDIETQYRIAVARGEMLAAEGKLKAAEDAFLMAKALKPNGFEAEFGQLRSGWGAEGARAEVSRRMRLLSKLDGLSARQAYEIGLFAYSKMEDKVLAAEMFAKVKQLDPALATQLQVDNLLQRAK